MSDQPSPASPRSSGHGADTTSDLDCFGAARPILIGLFGLWLTILIASALTS